MKRVYHHVPKRVTPAATRRDRLQDAIDIRSKRKIMLPYGAAAKAGVAYRFTADGVRLAYRRRDHAIPAALVALGAAVLRGADLPMRTTWFAEAVPYGRLVWLVPRWWWTPAAAAAVVLHRLRYPERTEEIELDRRDRADWDRFWSYCNISPHPIGLFIKRRPYSTTYTLKPKPSTTDAQIIGMGDTLRQGFERRVTIDKQKDTALWEVTVWERDLLATDPVWRELPVTPDRTPAGYDAHGHLVTLRLLRRNMMVGGTPDAGKSSFLKALIAYIGCIHPTLRRLHFADPQNGLAFLEFKAMSSSYGTTGAEIDAQIRNLLAIMDERGRQMAKAETDLATVSPAWPWHVLVVDELADVVAACDDDLIEKLARLMREGRKCCITVILCTQSFRATVIPPEWRDLCLVKVGFRVARSTNTNMLMGEGTKGDGWDLADIPDNQPGRGLVDNGSGPVEFRAIRLYGDHAKAVAARFAPAAPQPATETCVPQNEIGVPQPQTPVLPHQIYDLDQLAPLAGQLDVSIGDAIEALVLDSGSTPIRTEDLAALLPPRPDKTTGELKPVPARTVGYWLTKTGMVKRKLADGRQGWVHPTVAARRVQ